MTISASTLDDLMRQVLQRLIRKGTRVKASRGSTRELLGVALRLTDPRARLSHSEKKGKVFSGLGELTWYLSGSNDSKFVGYYISRYRDDAEKDGTIHGAYGPRLFSLRKQNQLRNVVKILQKKPSTRQAVIQLFDATDIARQYKDIPCTCFLQFLVRSNRLHLVTSMRSNDAYLGLPHDVFSFTMLQEIVARQLGYELGEYRHFVASLHLYDRNAADARKYLDEGWQTTEFASMPPIPVGDPWPSIQILLKAETAIRTGKAPAKRLAALSPYWQDLARLLQIYRLFRRGSRKQIAAIRKQMSYPGYDEYIRHKETSKLTAPRAGQPELFPESSSGNDVEQR